MRISGCVPVCPAFSLDFSGSMAAMSPPFNDSDGTVGHEPTPSGTLPGALLMLHSVKFAVRLYAAFR